MKWVVFAFLALVASCEATLRTIDGSFRALPGYWCVDDAGTSCITWETDGVIVNITTRSMTAYGYSGFEVWSGPSVNYPLHAYIGYVADGTRVSVVNPGGPNMSIGTPVGSYAYSSTGAPEFSPMDQSHCLGSFPFSCGMATTDGVNYTHYTVSRLLANTSATTPDLRVPRYVVVYTCNDATIKESGIPHYFLSDTPCNNPAWPASLNYTTGSYNGMNMLIDFSKPFSEFDAVAQNVITSADTPPGPPTGDSTYCAPGQQFCMRWNFPGDDTIRVSVRGLLRDALGTHMWVGVGFSTEANAMHGADAYVAWLEFNTSRPIMRAVDTYYVPELTISSSNIRLGDQTRFTFVSNIVANNMQEFEFSRPLQGSGMTRITPDGYSNIIWALGPQPTAKTDGEWVINNHLPDGVPALKADGMKTHCGVARVLMTSGSLNSRSGNVTVAPTTITKSKLYDWALYTLIGLACGVGVAAVVVIIMVVRYFHKSRNADAAETPAAAADLSTVSAKEPVAAVGSRLTARIRSGSRLGIYVKHA